MNRPAGAGEPGQPRARLDGVLLDVKLAFPPVRPGLVSRAPLTDEVRGSGAIAVGVTAPAGYGKSTLLIEWANRERRRVGWISLDRLDDDAGRLLFLLASAYERAMPEQAGLAAAVKGLGAAALARGAPYVAAALSRAPTPFVLLVDDLHELRAPACHDVLGVVLAAVPPGSQVVTASRHQQPHLPLLRAAGDAVELTAADLALDAGGAEQIFAAAHVDLTPEQAIAVTQRTEGWPVGLRLASLIAHEVRSDDWELSGEDPFIADYLQLAVFRRLDPAVREFLRRTAILDRLHGPLCDAVLEQVGATSLLRELEASSSFLTPLDRRRDWYRHHALFRDFLLAELRRTEPELIEKLHLRAADWFEAHGSPGMAVEHLLATRQRDRCAQLVAELALQTYGDGQISVVRRWLAALGDATIEAYPPLAVLAARLAAMEGETTGAERWASVAERSSFDLTPTDGSASLASSRSMLRALMCAAGPAQMRADAELAARAEPEWSPWRPTALCLLAEAQLLLDHPARATRSFEEASAAGRRTGNTEAVVLSEAGLALIDMDEGRWDDAAAHVERAQRTVEIHQLEDYAISLLPCAAAARLALHRAEPVAADRQLTRAMRSRAASTFAMPCLATRGRLQLAKVYWARGDHASTRHLLREIDDVLRHRPELGTLVGQVEDFRTLTTTSTTRAIRHEVPLTPAELRLLPYLQTHLKIADIAERLRVSRNTVASEVAAIYRKLGVSSRGEAVTRATLLGLLGE